MPDPFDAPRAGRRPRCPWCGAGLGRLAAAPNDPPAAPHASAADAAGWYCGCCGLVLPGGGA